MFTSSCKKQILTEEQEQQNRIIIEKRVLSYYGKQLNTQLLKGIDDNSYQIFDEEIKVNTYYYKIHTITMGDIQNPKIVLLHGYGGSFIHFSKILNKLSTKYYVIGIDLPGMGFSSKANININNYETTKQFFLSTLEQWRIKMRLDSFILVGHSFGGYVSALYTVAYPEHIEQLILLSPAGTTKYTQVDQEQFNKFYNDLNFFKKMFFKYARSLWSDQITIKELKNKIYGPYFLKRYLTKRMGFEGQEYDLWKQYNDEVLLLPIGSERALYYFFNFPLAAVQSIEELFIENQASIKNVQIQFYFGDMDWMKSQGAERLADSSNNLKIQFIRIKNAGHQMVFENPEGVFQQIYYDTMKLIQQNKQNGKQINEEEQKSNEIHLQQINK